MKHQFLFVAKTKSELNLDAIALEQEIMVDIGEANFTIYI